MIGHGVVVTALVASLLTGVVSPAQPNDRCGAPAPDLPAPGTDVVVDLPPAPAFTVGKIRASTWRDPIESDVSWRLKFEALKWMMPLAKRAALEGRQDVLDLLVAQTVAFHRQNPDPDSNEFGWDEGTALRRLEAENCLYALTHDRALEPGMIADSKVNLDWRYYGPPRNPVHNHGLLANLQLVRAANLLNRPAWRDTAIDRMVSEAPQAFSDQGVSYEQSSSYQRVNTNLWEQGAVILEESPGSEDAAAAIRAQVEKARTAYAWMTEPDGRIVQIGDADEEPGRITDLGSDHQVLRDDQTGWVIGRWSWTDPDTTYYTVRYGPPRRAHGHHDSSGGVTWSTKGVRVLVGPGRFSYDRDNALHAHQISPQSHNVARPDGRYVRTTSSSVVRNAAHTWTVRDKAFGIPHTRTVEVEHDAPSVRVKDSFSGSDLWRQWWHLDPQWTLASGEAGSTRLVFTHPAGRRLTVTTTGRVSSIVKGWHFPAFGQRRSAPEIVIHSQGGALETTFVVS